MKIQISEHFTYGKLIRFTIPTIIMMIFTSIYGVVDGIFVSNFVGSSEFAAVNFIMPVIMIVGSIGFMIGTGGSALVSKTIGEGKRDEADRYFSMLIYFVIIIGIVLSIAGIVLIKPIAALLGAEGNMLENCVVYGRVLLAAMVPYLLQNCFQSFLVVAEKPKLGLAVSIAAGMTNMVLDFLFIYVFKLGILGAAVATGISQVVGGIIPLLYFWKKSNNLQLVRTGFEKMPIIKSCINGSSEMMTNLSMSLVNMLYNVQLMKFAGEGGVVAYGIIMYVSFIFVGTYVGYSIGTAPIVGYHYGAGNKSELKSLFAKSLKILGFAALIMTILAEILSPVLAGIFVSYDSELLQMTTNAIRLYSISFLISAFNIYGSAFFTALSNGVISALISFLRTLVFQIVMILLLPSILGLTGIWLAVAVAEILAFFVTAACIMANRKKYEYM